MKSDWSKKYLEEIERSLLGKNKLFMAQIEFHVSLVRYANTKNLHFSTSFRDIAIYGLNVNGLLILIINKIIT